MKTIQCAICKEKQRLEVLYPATLDFDKLTPKTFSARRTPDRMHYQFLRCLRCGLIFSNPILDNNKIFSLYTKSEFDYPVESTFLKKTYGEFLDKIRKKIIGNNPKLLDIGCGNGFFLEEAKRIGFDTYGVEPGKASVAKARKDIRKNIRVSFFKKSLYKSNTFDVITCFHTLDHIIDINTFLNDVSHVVKKSGYIIFVVHNTDGLSVKLFGEKSPIFDIEHIYLFNKQTLSRLFTRYGFANANVFDVKNTYHLNYWIRMVPIPGLIKQSFLSLLKITKLGEIPIRLPAGNIGIIAQKTK